jgi:hypothetical protein
MQLSDTFIQRWEHILNDVEMVEVPVECIKKITLRLGQRKRKTINIALLRQRGLDLDEIEEVINNVMSEFDSDIVNVDFIVDVEAVAEMVQPHTDDLLKKL